MSELYLEEIIEDLKEYDALVYRNIREYPVVVLTHDGVFAIHQKLEKKKKLFADKDASELFDSPFFGKDFYLFEIKDGEAFYKDLLLEDLYVSFFGLFDAVTSGNLAKNAGLTDVICVSEYKEMEELEHNPAIGSMRYGQIKDVLDTADKGTVTDNSKYKTIDGVLHVRQRDTFGREKYYAVNEEIEADNFYMAAVFGGGLGIHKFMEHRFAMAILYLLSGGLFGVLWICDLLALVSGNYRLKNNTFIGPIKDKKKALMLLPIGIALGVLAFWLFAKYGGELYEALTNRIFNMAASLPGKLPLGQ